MTRVAVLGAGAMGAQIATGFALGGCSVVWIDEDTDSAGRRIEASLRLLAHHGLAEPAEIEHTRALLSPRAGPPGSEGRLTLIVESLPDRLELKAKLLGELAGLHPEALLATSGAEISPTALGEATGAGARMLCMHFLAPPLLVPVVELLAGADTPPRLVLRLAQLLKAIGKHPLVLGREAPGLVGERLRMALLRECQALVRDGIATPEQIDELVRDGLARQWRHVGPLEASEATGPTADRLVAGLATELRGERVANR